MRIKSEEPDRLGVWTSQSHAFKMGTSRPAAQIALKNVMAAGARCHCVFLEANVDVEVGQPRGGT